MNQASNETSEPELPLVERLRAHIPPDAKHGKTELEYDLSEAADELESPKSQLAEAQGKHLITNEELLDEYQSLQMDFDQALKQNHVLREALEYFKALAMPDSNAFNIAKQALSTPPIEGCVVCKDAPIYEIRVNGGGDYWIWRVAFKELYER